DRSRGVAATRDVSRVAMAESRELVRAWPVELLLLWERSRGNPDPDLVAGLEQWWSENAPAADVAAVAERWGGPRGARTTGPAGPAREVPAPSTPPPAPQASA